jgi:small subunit ribosomal protein S1
MSEEPTNQTAAPQGETALENLSPEISDQDLAEEIIKVESLKERPDHESKEFVDMMLLYSQSLREIREGEVVRGRIVAINDKEIAIDIGFKAEGTIPIEEFQNPELLHIGDEITVFLDKVEDQEGQLLLSKRKADFMATWDNMVRNFETQAVIKGKITRRIKGGMVVDLNGIDAFLPGSQIDIHPIRDFDALVGQDMDFRIVKINELRKNIVLSHKVLIEESLAEVREKILLEMDIGSVMEGTVKNITDFGVFVDLGGVDGLLHITDLSWGRIRHPSEVVKLDEKITVKIIDFDPLRKRVSIGYKQLQPHPWEGVEKRYPIGAKVKGKVVSITNYGAFIELEKGVEGLIHVSEMSWTQHIKHPSALLSIGDEVEALVLSMDAPERKISLGMKQVEPDPWETLETKYGVGSKHTGVVRELVPFGAFVELEDNIEGLVHISDLSWTKKVRHPGEVVKKGDEIDVVILGFDRGERRIALGYKQIHESPWDKFETIFTAGAMTKGKVVRMIDKGVIVELPEGVEGFVPNSQLGRDDEGSIRKRLTIGVELDLAVMEFEKEAKRIVLSAVEARKQMEKAEFKEFVESRKEEAKEEAQEKPKEEIAPTKAKPKAKKEKAKKAPKVEKPPAETAVETTEMAETSPAEAPIVPEPEAPVEETVLESPEEKPQKAKPKASKPRAKKSAKPKAEAQEETSTENTAHEPEPSEPEEKATESTE